MQDKIKTDFGISINDDCMNVIKKRCQATMWIWC